MGQRGAGNGRGEWRVRNPRGEEEIKRRERAERCQYLNIWQKMKANQENQESRVRGRKRRRSSTQIFQEKIASRQRE